MKRMIAIVFSGVLAAGGVSAMPKAIDPKLGCRTHPALVGPCFEVRGSVVMANGYPTFRIFKRGTKRVLGIAGGEEPIAPKCLKESVSDLATTIEGKFVVCPFSKDRPGHMLMVCVSHMRSAA